MEIETIKIIFDTISVFFIIYLIGYSTFLFLSVVIGATTLYHKKMQNRLMNKFTDNYFVPITIVVPAYNEEVTVVQTVKSLLTLDYKLYEIVVVDDGSKDTTSKQLIDAYNMHPVRRPLHRSIACQPEEFIYESHEQKVPLTLIRKKTVARRMHLIWALMPHSIPTLFVWMQTRFCSMTHSKSLLCLF